jgi:predicted house-cleaning noncanonical NTP pyrophosphatase (MazG superfamily)
MLLAEVTFQFPPLTIGEIAALATIATCVLTAAAGLLNLAIGSKFVKAGQCAAIHLASDTTRTSALVRVANLEVDSALTKTHLEQIEEHLRSVNRIAEAQSVLETKVALSQQPITEFAAWMKDVKDMLREYIEKTEARTMDHEKRLTVVETQLAAKHTP